MHSNKALIEGNLTLILKKDEIECHKNIEGHLKKKWSKDFVEDLHKWHKDVIWIPLTAKRSLVPVPQSNIQTKIDLEGGL